MREPTFIDSSGVHAIVNASVRARNDAGLLVLVSAAPRVDRVFVLKGSSRRGEIYADPTGPAVEPLRSRAVEQQIASPPVPLSCAQCRYGGSSVE